jgi:hypothetical protein
MRQRSALGIAILACLLILVVAAPAQAAPRLRLFRGQTSQEHNIRFVVGKTDAGRSVRQMDVLQISLTCEDKTTMDFGFGFGFGRGQVPIIDGAFSFDDLSGEMAIHIAGELGSLQGQGTLSLTLAQLTPDEQAQLCTTGDLTWSVEFVRKL